MSIRLFPPREGDVPRVFALPPGVDFAAELLAGLRARAAGAKPEALAGVEILVNTERTRRRLLALLEAGPVALPPRILTFSDLAADLPGLPQPIPPLRRRLELARLIRKLIAERPGGALRAAAHDMAESLARLLGEMQMEGVGFDALAGIEAAEISEHWQKSLRFLELIRPVLDADDGPVDPEARLRAAAEATVAGWAARPPRHPVIVAGSTGSRGATRLIMQAVARLEQGAVVLPGADPHLPAGLWSRLDPDESAADHPQFGIQALGAALGFDPAALPGWTETRPHAPARNKLISLTLRPAPVTDQWLAEGPVLKPALAEATRDVTLIEAADQRREAEAIAWCLRGALARGETAALVTPDRMLARRVRAALDRWRIAPDDSAGRPLALTPPGVFLRLVAEALAPPLTAVGLMRLLKHPLTASGGGQRARHGHFAAALETGYLRGGPPFVAWGALKAWAGRKAGNHRGLDRWAGWLEDCLSDVITAPAPLETHLDRHLAAARALAAGPEGDDASALWETEAGEAAARTVDEFSSAAAAGGVLEPAEYRALLRRVLGAADVPDAPYAPHPDIAIWGTLEARTQSADLIVLGGLNEGTWPRLPQPEPWLSRAMRAAAGLPLPERRIGLSAHDFQQAAGARRVVLSRALRDGDAPAVPARWLLRLTNLLDGLGDEGPAALEAMRGRGQEIAELAARLDMPAAPAGPARRPAPAPPAEARPGELPVTQIERLVRDPYAVYARYVLGLRKLDDLGRSPDPLQRGISNHTVLELFVRETMDGLPEDAAALLLRIARKELDLAAPWPATRALWLARLAAIADWFIEGEKERRAFGRPALLEERGEAAVAGTPRPFTLTAKPDRIDIVPGGGVAIYDYKSGLPSAKEAAKFSKQLPLEAGIAARGGFGGIPAAAAARLELIGLSKAATLAFDVDTDRLEADWQDLVRLISLYQRADTPFPSRLRPKKLTDWGDYDHLARRGEWRDGDPIAPEQVP